MTDPKPPVGQQAETEGTIYREPPRVEGKHRFMAGTCVDCGRPFDELCTGNLELPVASPVALSGETQIKPPPPHNQPSKSGKLLLRIPKTLHVELEARAQEEGVSLNQWLLMLVSRNHVSTPKPISLTEVRQVLEQINYAAFAHANYDGPCSDGSTYQFCDLECIQANRLWRMAGDIAKAYGINMSEIPPKFESVPVAVTQSEGQDTQEKK